MMLNFPVHVPLMVCHTCECTEHCILQTELLKSLCIWQQLLLVVVEVEDEAKAAACAAHYKSILNIESSSFLFSVAGTPSAFLCL